MTIIIRSTLERRSLIQGHSTSCDSCVDVDCKVRVRYSTRHHFMEGASLTKDPVQYVDDHPLFNSTRWSSYASDAGPGQFHGPRHLMFDFR